MSDRYAVVGQPISHSRSPQIHSAFAQQTSQNLIYGAIEVAPAALADTLKDLHAQGYAGLNITLPHKIAVMALCEEVSDRARLAGAVNTLIRTDGGWRGDNTDGEGFIKDLQRLGIAVAGRRVLVLGAGGAVRGILEPLLRAKPGVLVVSNRNPWKPEALAEDFRSVGTLLPRTHIALKGDQYDLIINATSAGHSGQMITLPPDLLAAGCDCYDLSYGKAFAPFAGWAKTQKAARVEDGLGMLVGQAAAAFALWRGVAPQTTPVIAALRS